jgi:carbonic anhydrase
MIVMTSIDTLLERNATTTVPTAAPARPSLGVAILTCMDARIQVGELFGLRRGEAHVLRNGGGVVTDDAIRSLSLSQHELGTTELMIVQHTTCGLSSTTDDAFKDTLEQASGLRPTWSVETFRDVTASVRQSLRRARRSPFLAHTDHIRGFVYDVTTGALSEVTDTGDR